MVTMNKNSINELAKEVLDIEANSILRLKTILVTNLIKPLIICIIVQVV